jgi:sulfide:quinone oxidoreductase
MKKLLILGGGTAGTIMANKLSDKLSSDEWKITVVDKEKDHYYQPGFLFIPFGYYQKKDIVKSLKKFFPKKVEIVNSEILGIDYVKNIVSLQQD